MPEPIYTPKPRKPAETFEGKPCRKCGNSSKYTSNRRCVACRRVYDKSPNGRAADQRRNQTLKRKTYKKNQSESFKSYRRNYYHTEKAQLYWKSLKGKAVRIVAAQKRKAKLKTISGFYTTQEWLDLKEHYGNICLCCRKHESELVRPLEQDHVIPITKPGTSNWITNIQPLCHDCNGMGGKGTKIIDYRPQAI